METFPELTTLAQVTAELRWTLGIFAGWLAGEVLARWISLPRISAYAMAGFLLGPAQLGLLPEIGGGQVLLLANIAFGLILFEAGHRLNLRWLQRDRWLAAVSALESTMTFLLVYLVARWFDVSVTTALLLAALAMATSPATVLRVINEQQSSGQVTERALHLSVLNSMLAVMAFKLIVGYSVFESSGNLMQAGYASLLVLATSVLLGVAFGVALPALLRALGRAPQDATMVFAISVILLVALTHVLKQSPVLATLAFGIIARHRRIVLGRAERGFGTLGELLSVLLFVSVASAIHWQLVLGGLVLGLAILCARWIAKIGVLSLLARPSGLSWRKGALTGVAMTPFSVFVILVLEQTRHLGINLVDQLSALAAAALLVEVVGPVLVRLALRLAHELPDQRRE